MANSIGGNIRSQAYAAIQEGGMQGVSEASKAFLEGVMCGVPNVVLKAARFFWESRSVRMSNEIEAQSYRNSERQAWRTFSETAPNFLNKGFVVNRPPSPDKYGKFSAQDAPYGPGVRNCLRGSQEQVVLEGRLDTAHDRVRLAARQVLECYGEVTNRMSTVEELQRHLDHLENMQFGGDSRVIEMTALRIREISQQLKYEKYELSKLREWMQFVVEELKVAIQRSKSAQQQLANHRDMDGWFW